MQVPSHFKDRDKDEKVKMTSNKICKESTLQKEEVGGRGHHV
jgi:hypothetical protein